MSKRAKIKYSVIVGVMIAALVCIVLSVNINTKLSGDMREMIVRAYDSRGVISADDDRVISQEDLQTLAGYDGNTDAYTDPEYEWSYKIRYVHTFCVGMYAYSYVCDSCHVTDEQFNSCTGYSNRSLKVTWKLTKDGWVVEDVYDYIVPGFFQRFVFLDDPNNYIRFYFVGYKAD